jgi:hypothetical protein
MPDPHRTGSSRALAAAPASGQDATIERRRRADSRRQPLALTFASPPAADRPGEDGRLP